MLELLALACLLGSTIWSAIQRAWPLTLLAAGLTLWLLSTTPINVGH